MQLTQKIKAIEIRLFDVILEKKMTYHGYDLKRLLDHVYQDNWLSAKSLIISANDGYRKKISIERLKQYLINKKAYIVFSSKKNKLPSFIKGTKSVSLSPLYIVWAGANRKNLKKMRKKYAWIYQLKSLGIVSN